MGTGDRAQPLGGTRIGGPSREKEVALLLLLRGCHHRKLSLKRLNEGGVLVRAFAIEDKVESKHLGPTPLEVLDRGCENVAAPLATRWTRPGGVVLGHQKQFRGQGWTRCESHLDGVEALFEGPHPGGWSQQGAAE
jgi:hypothetical protein